MTKSRNILPPRVTWAPEQTEIVRTRYPHERTADIAADFGMSISRVYGKATKLGLFKTDEYMASPAACRLRRGDKVGEQYKFPKGNIPYNKGVKGICHPGCVATQFKPGQRTHSWKPLGSERITVEGYLERKVSDTGYKARDWVGVHVLLWREHHGDVPVGHAVVFKNGNKKIIEIENLELISRAELMKRNSIHTYPKEVVHLIQLRGALNRQIKRRSKDEQEPTSNPA